MLYSLFLIVDDNRCRNKKTHRQNKWKFLSFYRLPINVTSFTRAMLHMYNNKDWPNISYYLNEWCPTIATCISLALIRANALRLPQKPCQWIRNEWDGRDTQSARRRERTWKRDASSSNVPGEKQTNRTGKAARNGNLWVLTISNSQSRPITAYRCESNRVDNVCFRFGTPYSATFGMN